MKRNLISQEEADRWEREQRAKENTRKFLDICPKLYVDSNPSLLDEKAFRRVVGWKMGQRGMMLIGFMRTGKTRAVWQLVKRLMVQEDIHPTYIKATELSQRLYDAYTGSRTEATEHIVNRFKYCRLLIIDDLGKEPMTPRYLSLLYEIIDARNEMGKPLIVTTNCTGDQLAEKIADDTIALPLIERIREMCEQVVFKRKGEPKR